MSQIITITLYEHESKKYNEIRDIKNEKLPEHLLKLNRYFENNLKKNIEKNTSNDNPDTEEEIDESKAILEVYSNKVKARHYVGFGAVGNILIQILPKVFKLREDQTQTLEETWKSLLAFIRMLDRAYGLKIKDHDLAYLQGRKLQPNLYEVFIYLFAQSLWNEVQRGYHREYVEVHGEEKFLRGKLLLGKQIKKLPHQRHTFSVEIHELMEDNLLNRIFYASVMEAMRRTSWGTNKKRLGELMLVFGSVTQISLRAEHFERVHFTRLNERFRRPFELAKLLFMPPKATGKVREVSGFFVDMNELFERFIAKTITSYLPEGYNLLYQKGYPFLKRKNCTRSENKCSLPQRPDYVIIQGKKPISVLDAKYRELKENMPSPDMARQLYVYSRIIKGYREKSERETKVPTVLVFPSSKRYNNDIKDKCLEFEFFDGTKLYIISYNMEHLKKENASNADWSFKKSLDKVIGHQ